ncbi:MAG TPA: hypothetical protein VEF72_03535 [Mycobacterium sp.]|nr:hypothetical protein [Mycobacterium sp.]
MAVPGPISKPHRRGRAQLTHGWTEVQAVPNREGPRLPPRRANGRPWPRSAKEKWRAWARMPHTVLWADSDWSFAADSLELVARAAENDAPPVALVSEIRLREKEMGATWDARQTLRLRYVASLPDGDGQAGPVSRLDDYRNL